MKKALFLIFFIPLIIGAQEIGKLAPPDKPEEFPPNQFGADLIFSEGGFGLGTFYKRIFTSSITGFVDFSISEIKDEREVDYVDYFGRSYTFNKKNRAFLMPLNFGIQYRIFKNSLTDNLRPYLAIAMGPNFVLTSPFIDDDYRKIEFFKSLKYAKMKFAFGGYFGFGANFGLSKSSLMGLNVRYYYTHFFNDGLENFAGQFRKNVSGIYITITIGTMF